jgi:hypothetical protein
VLVLAGALALAVVVAAVALAGDLKSHHSRLLSGEVSTAFGASGPSGASGTTGTTGVTGPTGPSATTGPSGATTPLAPQNPFTTHAMGRFLAQRSGNITAAVYDVRTNTTFLYHPGDREQTASIVKVDILATLLGQAQAQGTTLDAGERAVATGMIEQSDNDDATTLWDDEGGPGAVAAFDAKLGMTQTTPNLAWGLTETTPRDQLRLLRHIALTNDVLHYQSRAYELYLMEHVIAFDYWGVSAGPSRGTTVALKNGWLPVGNGWQINSIGAIQGAGRHYLIAVMTNANPDEAYGIDTIEGISRIVWSTLAVNPVSHTALPAASHRA